MPTTVIVNNQPPVVIQAPDTSRTVLVVQTPGVGPPGANGSGSSYFHTQGVPSNVWTIPHNLGFYPNVSAFDTQGDEIEGTQAYAGVNTVTITFSVPISGTAVLS